MEVYDIDKRRYVFVNLNNIETLAKYTKSEKSTKKDTCLIGLISGNKVLTHASNYKKIINELEGRREYERTILCN